MEPTDLSKTAAYYAQHAQAYFERTSELDLSKVYEPFERRLKPGSRILDLGCGGGRDAAYRLVDSVLASTSMAASRSPARSPTCSRTRSTAWRPGAIA